MKKQNKKFFNKEGKLNEIGIILCADALRMGKEKDLPEEILFYLQTSEVAQQQVFEHHQLSQDLDLGFSDYPYFQKGKFYTNLTQKWRFWTILLASVALFTTLFFINFSSSEKTEAKADVSKKQRQKAVKSTKIKSLIPELDVKFVKKDRNGKALKVDNAKGGNFILENGTRINIPKNTFTDKKGKLIKGKVKVDYREFHTGLEIVASGIPMTYKNGHFESAGMFEIRGRQGKKEVKIAPKKSIEVAMASFGKDEEYEHYYLNQEKNEAEWEFLENTNQKPNPDFEEVVLTRQISSLDEDGNETIVSMNTITRLSEGDFSNEIRKKGDLVPKITGDNTFKLHLNSKDFPELKTFEDINWEWIDRANPTENPFTNNTLKNRWDKLKLTALTKEFYKSWKIFDGNITSQFFFDNQEKQVIIPDDEGNAKLINLDTQKSIKLEGVWKAKFSPNGKHFLTSLDDVKLWSNQGKLLKDFGLPTSGVQSMSFSPNGKYIIIIAKDGTASIYTLSGKFMIKLRYSKDVDYAESNFTFENYKIQNALFSPDNQYIITENNQKKIKIWNFEGKIIKTPNYLKKYKFSKNGKSLISEAELEKKRLLDFEISQNANISYTQDAFLLKLLTDKEDLNLAVFSPNGKYLITKGSTENKLEFYLRKTPSKAKSDMFILELSQKYSSFPFKMVVKMTSEEKLDTEEVYKIYQEKIGREIEKEEKRQAQEAEILRTFQVKKFGIYNTDRLYKMGGELLTFQASFDFQKELKVFNDIKVYLITGSRNTAVITYPEYEWQNFKFNPKENNQIIAVLPEQKIAVLSKEDFKKLDIDKISRTKKHHFKTTFTSIEHLAFNN